MDALDRLEREERLGAVEVDPQEVAEHAGQDLRRRDRAHEFGWDARQGGGWAVGVSRERAQAFEEG
jgi:hypothetical protein